MTTAQDIRDAFKARYPEVDDAANQIHPPESKIRINTCGFESSRGADIANTGINSQRQIIPLRQIGLDSRYDLEHSHHAFVEMYDGGKMDVRKGGDSLC